MTKLFTAILLLTCVACSITRPIVAKSNRGEHFYGTATASLGGKVTFEAISPNGTRCFGTYDSLDTSPALPIKFKLSDGRTGNAVVMRDSSGLNGFGSGQCSDGSTFKFILGDVDRVTMDW